MLQRLHYYFEQKKDYGAIFLRLIIGWRLIYGTQDNVLSWERMVEFEHFLAQQNVPMPLLAAVVSVYAQFICGILYVAGAYVRLAAVMMIVNFVAALLIAHIGAGFLDSFDALMMLFGSVFFLFHGGGKFSLDNIIF